MESKGKDAETPSRCHDAWRSLGEPTKLCHRCNAEFTPRVISPPIPVDALRGSLYPDETLIDSTRTSLREEKEELLLYDEEIRRVRQVLESLESKRQALSQIHEKRQGILSPIRKLPPELWTRIFSYVCHSKEPYYYTLHIDDDKGPPAAIAISQVCSRWRNIVCAIPRLWSSIYMNAKAQLFSRRGVKVGHLIQTYLSRSKGCHLKIAIVDDAIEVPVWRGLWPKPQLATLNLLLQQAIRCEVLHLRIRWLPMDLPPVFFNLPRLRELHAVLEVSNRSATWISNTLEKAPNVSVLSVYSLSNTVSSAFGQLTSLAISELNDIPSLQRLLSTHRKITTLAIWEIRQNARQAPGPVKLPHIKALRIGPFSASPEYVTPMLDSLILPSLATFDFSDTPAPSTSSFQGKHEGEDKLASRELTLRTIAALNVVEAGSLILPKLISIRLMLLNDIDTALSHELMEGIIDMVGLRSQEETDCVQLETVTVCFSYVKRESIARNPFKEGPLADRVREQQSRGTKWAFEYDDRQGCDAKFTPRALSPPISARVFREVLDPDTALRSATQETLREEEQDLRLYDEEISRLRHVLGALESKRADLWQIYRERQSFLSTKRKLPPELWHKIFGYVCLSGDSLRVEYRISKPSMVLSHVCTHWRNIIHNMPDLWTSIYLTPSDHRRRGPKPEYLIRHYLHYSRELPLTATIISPQRNHGFVTASMWTGRSFAALRLLLQQMKRFVKLTLSLYDEDLVAVEHLDISFPNLRELHTITIPHIPSGSTTSMFWLALLGAPNLSNLSVSSLEAIVPVDIPVLNQITSFAIDSLTELPPLMTFLSTKRNITSLTIRSFPPESSAHAIGPVTLPHIKVLRIEHRKGRPRCITPLLDSVILPSLHTFEARSDYVTSLPHSFPSLATFFQRSGCSLKSLVLRYPKLYLSEKDVMQAFKAVPSLTHLEVYLRGDNQQTQESTLKSIALLGATSGASPNIIVLPNLTSLHITIYNDKCTQLAPEVTEGIVSVVDSRCQEEEGRVRLQKIVIRFCWSPPSNPFREGFLNDRIQEMQARGTQWGFEYTGNDDKYHSDFDSDIE
ncbi:hypothetical protein VNI00_014608 [Paramarasmius palmivorus]|uniref:F-box domain-containing protein n=1 Tax=Paramarasmius palmivorus TaxID=297713 RepID=A0AAW0BSL8_9AGAR